MKKLAGKIASWITVFGLVYLFEGARAFAQGTHGSWFSHPGMTMGWGMGIFGMLSFETRKQDLMA